MDPDELIKDAEFRNDFEILINEARSLSQSYATTEPKEHQKVAEQAFCSGAIWALAPAFRLATNWVIEDEDDEQDPENGQHDPSPNLSQSQ